MTRVVGFVCPFRLNEYSLKVRNRETPRRRKTQGNARGKKSEVRNNKNQLLERKSIDDTSNNLNSGIQAGENNFQTKKLLTSDFTLLTSPGGVSHG